VSHDPRAPRLAAIATLVAGGLLVLSATNLQFNLVGQAGITREEMLAVVGAALAIIVARFANEEHEVPELGESIQRIQSSEDGYTQTRAASPDWAEVNPTTASIITSILGERTTTDAQQVDSAITTLSSGAFGASVLETIREAEAGNQRNKNVREAQPTNEETGQTLKRVLVQPVPLPGREHEPLVDPKTIPGLNPDREFVRDGLAHVPLPGAEPAHVPLADAEPMHVPLAGTEPIDVPELPEWEDDESNDDLVPPSVTTSTGNGEFEATVNTDLPELPDLSESLGLPELPDAPESPDLPVSPGLPELPDLSDLMDEIEPKVEEIQDMFLPELEELPELVLPDIGDLLAEEETFVATGPAIGVPDLPDLDDLF
jgi:hypothetical protein